MDSRLRKRPTQGRSRVTVTSILEAADRVLRAHGYEAASTNRLARVAGFSVGSLYQYFRDKQAIVGALIDRELVAEAEVLASLLDRRPVLATPELIDAAVALLIERRNARAHLYRTLDHYASDLGAPVILTHLVAAQAPILSDVLQRVGAQTLPRGVRSVDARVYTLARLVSGLAYAFAVDAPAALDASSLRSALKAAVERYLAGAPAGADAMALVLGWSKAPGNGVAPADVRARRRRESRALLLGCGLDPAQLEPSAFLLSCLGEVSAATVHAPSGLSLDEIRHEIARFVDALRAA